MFGTVSLPTTKFKRLLRPDLLLLNARRIQAFLQQQDFLIAFDAPELLFCFQKSCGGPAQRLISFAPTFYVPRHPLNGRQARFDRVGSGQFPRQSGDITASSARANIHTVMAAEVWISDNWHADGDRSGSALNQASKQISRRARSEVQFAKTLDSASIADCSVSCGARRSTSTMENPMELRRGEWARTLG